MALFKRQDQGNVQQASAAPETGGQRGQPEQLAMMPPVVSTSRGAASGVVPPPASAMYSVSLPESAPRVEGDTASLVAEKVRMASEAQQSVQERVRVAIQRARMAASPATRVRRRPAQPAARPSFDPTRCAQAGLLNLAWSWQQAGAPIRAIHAYMQVLSRYPDTPAAGAAVADLAELSDILAQQGQFHTALAIYDQLEQLL